MTTTTADRVTPRHTSTAAFAIAVGAVLGLAGCTGTPPDDNTTKATATASPDRQTTASPSEIAVVAAGKAALAATQGATVISVESERAGSQWEVETLRGGAIQVTVVSADDNSVLSGPTTKREDSKDIAEHAAQVKAATLDFADAATIMLRQVTGGTVTELNLDDRRGVVVWEADVIDGSGVKHEVAIDAASGAVVANTTDASDD